MSCSWEMRDAGSKSEFERRESGKFNSVRVVSNVSGVS